jgi:hypothetical protein
MTLGLVNVSGIPDCFFALMKNCLSVVIISRVWDVVIILCFHGASGGSTLLTLAFPCINGAMEVTQNHLRGYGHPNFLVALCASTLGM